MPEIYLFYLYPNQLVELVEGELLEEEALVVKSANEAPASFEAGPSSASKQSPQLLTLFIDEEDYDEEDI